MTARSERLTLARLTPTHVFTDGGLLKSNPSPLGGTWAWCHVAGLIDYPWTRTIGDWGYFTPELFGGLSVTNNQSELYAVVLALEALPDGWWGVVCSDSLLTLQRLRTWHLQIGEAVRVRNIPRDLQMLVWGQVARLQWDAIEWRLVGSHPTQAHLIRGKNDEGVPVSVHNKWCDDHCKEAANRFRADVQDDARLRGALDPETKLAVLGGHLGAPPNGPFRSALAPSLLAVASAHRTRPETAR